MNQYSNNNINKSIKKEISRTLQTQKKAAKQLAQDLLELKSYREKRLGEFEDFVEKIEENDYTVHLKTTSKNDSFDNLLNAQIAATLTNIELSFNNLSTQLIRDLSSELPIAINTFLIN